MGVVHSRISESSDQQAIWRHSLQFFAWQQEPTPKLRPRQRPSHGTAMVAFTATVSQPGEVMALAMATARGLLMLMLSPRLMLTSDMVDSTAMVLVWAMAATAMGVLATDTARGLLMLRPMPTLDTVDSTATVLVLAMAAMAMEVLATTARGPLMPRPMPTLDMVAFMATVLVWAMAMAVLATAVLATAMARGQLMPSPRPMPGSDMAACTATDSQPMAVTATDCGARSKQNQIPRLTISYNTPNDLTGLYKHP